MTTHVTTRPRHMHRCAECQREFYLCSERDCTLAPEVCQGCEMDRQDAFFDKIEAARLGYMPVVTISEAEFRAQFADNDITPKEPTHEP